MRVKISSPEKLVYQGEIKSITIPTESGPLHITEMKTPMVNALKPGIINLVPFESIPQTGYIFHKNELLISVSKGMVFIDGKMIRIVTEAATTLPAENLESMIKRKELLEKEIQLLRMKGSIEKIAITQNNLEKVNADIQLGQLQLA